MLKHQGLETLLPTNQWLMLTTWDDKQLVVKRSAITGKYELFSEATSDWQVLDCFEFDSGSRSKSIYGRDHNYRVKEYYQTLRQDTPSISFSVAGQEFHLWLKDYKFVLIGGEIE